jgi:AcrR family transcriptional regulator
MVVTERKTKELRCEEILDAAMTEFAERGLHGASTEEIARRAGISQPYVFRLFGTKKELFKAVITRCFRETLEMFQRSAEGLRGSEALAAIGKAYVELVASDPVRLQAQLQAYAACHDPELCEAVKAGYGDLVSYIERVSDAPPAEVAAFFAQGMLLNVFAAMGHIGGQAEPWAERLLAACGKGQA